MNRKSELRQQMRIKRDEVESSFKKNYDDQVCDELWKLVQIQNARTVHVYLPMGSEIDIRPFIQLLLDHDIQVVAPRTLPKRQLEHRVLTSLNEVEQGVYGTTHPANPEPHAGSIDLIVVPGLAFDQNNYRLGYGGGYYDGFLAHHTEVQKIGVCYPFQLVDEVPREEHDEQLDAVYHPTILNGPQ